MDKPDAELVIQYIKGDEVSFDVLTNRHLKAVYNFVCRFTGRTDDAEDIVQEVFLKVWKNLNKYNPQRNFRTWLLSIAHNTAIDFLRKKKGVPFSEFEVDGGNNSLTDNLSDPAPLPPEIFAIDESKKLLEGALVELSPNYRAVLLLRYQNDITFEEIGQILGKPLHTVKSQHRRALIQLRKLLLNMI